MFFVDFHELEKGKFECQGVLSHQPDTTLLSWQHLEDSLYCLSFSRRKWKCTFALVINEYIITINLWNHISVGSLHLALGRAFCSLCTVVG